MTQGTIKYKKYVLYIVTVVCAGANTAQFKFC